MTRGGVYILRNFKKRVSIDQKFTPANLFLIYSSIDKLWSIRKKKIYYFCTKNFQIGLVKDNKRIHILFNIDRRKKVIHKNAVVLYYERKKNTKMREELLTRGGACILRNMYPSYFFFKLKKLLFLCLQGKRRENYYQSKVLFYWYAKTIMKQRKQIWIRGCNYLSAEKIEIVKIN